MKVSILQENLAAALRNVRRAVPNRPSMPILGNILLETEEGRLKIAATDLEMGVTHWIGAKIEEGGAITIPAWTFIDLVNILSSERVDLDLNVRTKTLNIHCGATNSNIKGIDATEFPLIPDTGDAPAFSIPGAQLREAIAHAAFAAARDDNRPVLNAVYMSIEADDNELTLAAADGYRLSVFNTFLPGPAGCDTTMLVPARALTELARIVPNDDEPVMVYILPDGNRAAFSTKNADVSVSLLHGKFPDFQTIIPKSFATTTVVYTADLLRACKRAEIFARDANNNARLFVQPADVPSTPGSVKMVAQSAERGDVDALVDASVEGGTDTVNLNVAYMLDALGVLDAEQVMLLSNGQSQPVVLKPYGRDNFVHVIMPMSTGR